MHALGWGLVSSIPPPYEADLTGRKPTPYE
jgi:hypothetical protein